MTDPVEELNQAEADVVSETGMAGHGEPNRALVLLSTVARGGVLWLVIAAVMALQGGRARRAGVRGAAAVGISSAVTNLVAKRLVRRRRPTTRDVGARPVPPEESPSFPSSHSASAAAFTTALYIEKPAFAAAVAPLAVLVSYSRLRLRVHWPSDILGGWLLGAAAALSTRVVRSNGRQ